MTKTIACSSYLFDPFLILFLGFIILIACITLKSGSFGQKSELMFAAVIKLLLKSGLELGKGGSNDLKH